MNKIRGFDLRYGLVIILWCFVHVVFAQDNNAIMPTYGNLSFSYNQVPENLVSDGGTPAGYTFQWEKSTTPVEGFTPVPGALSSSYTFTAPLSQTSYFRRVASSGLVILYSNVIKLELVSVNWENINYVREHDILIPGQTDWKVIDQLPIGSKMQTTTYMDGIGRPVQKVSRETATPADPNNPATLWGDMVQFSNYDALGRQPKSYLPYTTTTTSGKYKTTPLTEQAAYYTSNYNETAPYSSVTFDNTPLSRVINVKSPGTSWAAGLGNSNDYDLNDASDNVQIFTIGYNTGDIPVNNGLYLENTLYKIKSTDENGKQVIEYLNNLGQLILRKVQIDDAPAGAYAGWICVYNVYDDFGLLRYSLQPEAVKYLSNNSWSFTGTNGTQVLNELCFRYEYDEKGRTILKKAPGAAPLRMIYDDRDRVVFMQDGNQALMSVPEWTTNLYDELDRPVATVLYHTNKTVATLTSDLATAPNVSTVFIAAQSVSLATYRNPIPASELNNAALSTIVKYNFYDEYNYAGVKAFNTGFDNTLAYPTGGEAITPTLRTTSMVTGSKTRVLGTTIFLSNSIYYDDEGRPIQTSEDNIKASVDITTMQYQWDGRLLSSNIKHTAAGSVYSAYSIVTKNNFDKIGRVTSIEKKFGTNPFKAVGAYNFDDMGRLKNKRLDPGYTGTNKTEIETLNYSYNIQNEITGINKDYALKAAGYSKTNNFFGMYLGYDNRDNVFTKGQLDGHVTGIVWNTQGDAAQRRYDFTYDNAGRLTGAGFTEKEKPTDTWGTLKMDLSVGGSGTGNTITYDLNGNLQSMFQKTVLPGTTAATSEDNLAYTYTPLSNKLTKVTDNGTLGTNNGKLGDFADGTNPGDDYVYDANGNLIIDLNKNATGVTGGVTTPIGTSGIKYNFLDKPEEIRITGKGVIKMVYDADGNRLQRSYTPDGGTTKTTSYISEFVYEDNTLQYINFEEGRLRVMQAVSQNNGFDVLTVDGNMDLPDGKRGAYDFFVRDYQSNVRMILTEETHFGRNICTMETNRVANEEPVFGQTGAGNEVASTRVDKPALWAANASAKVSMLSSGGNKVGPNVLLKVMSGDLVSAQANYYFTNTVTNSSGPNNLISSVLTALANAISGSGATNTIIKGAEGNINTTLNGSVPFGAATAPDATNASGIMPKAYLTILFFDERFNFIGEEGSTSQRVQNAGDGTWLLNLPSTIAPKNGYAYIYVSNESAEPVYFDNIQVAQDHKRIIEEDHYYAYGLKIAAISSKKLGDATEGSLKNSNLYNDKELDEDADLDWYNYGFRSYDPQIGRFPQLDPLTWEYPELTNYQYASCEPIANIDRDGLEAEGVLLEGVTVISSARKAAQGVLGAATILSVLTPILHNVATYSTVNAIDKSINSYETPINPGAQISNTTSFNGQDYYLESTNSYTTYDAQEINLSYDPTYQKGLKDELAKKEFWGNIKFYATKASSANKHVWENGYGQKIIKYDNTGFGNQDGGTELYFNVITLGSVAIEKLAFKSTVEGGFGAMMEESEATRYAKFWEGKAPNQVAPGTTRMDWSRVSSRTGRMENSRVIFDEYGRQTYRVDFTDHMRPLDHSNPHLHEYEYGQGFFPNAKETLHNFK